MKGSRYIGSQMIWYCWWKKSCTTWHIQNLANPGIFSIWTGAGFLPSTVAGRKNKKWPRFMFPTAKSWGQIPTIEVGFPQRATFPIRISFVSLFHSFLFKFHPSPLIIFPTGFYSDSLRLPQIPQEIRRTSQLYPFALQGLREMIAISLGQEIQCGTFPCILPAKGSDWVEEGIGSPSGSKWG